MIDDLFCPKCKRLKRKCICEKERIRERNLKLLKKIGYKEFLKHIFDCEDEIILYKAFQPFNAQPTENLSLPKPIVNILVKKGIKKLYPFQAEAIRKLNEGKNVVITAPTGFGKTEAFVIPMLLKLALGGKAIVFYPTKALARDQELKIKDYASSIGLKAVRYDGDSTIDERRAVLSGEAEIILTNPDMVDYHLRNNPAFRKVIKEVVFVVVDELHAYTGLFGSNMHYLIKRLSRFASFQIACTSATLSNAKEFAEELFEKEFVHVHGEHRKGVLNFIMRFCVSVYASAKDIVKAVYGKKVLIFGNSYKSVETLNWVLNREGIKAAVHKSGLPREVREEVEKAFRDGVLKVVVATPTLELGIDIGDVDVVISELIPYSQFLQRVGRAGRKGQESVGVLLLRGEDSISTYYKIKPEEYFKDESSGFVEKGNEEVMKYQIISMCLEKPARLQEFGQNTINMVKKLIEDGLIVKKNNRLFATEKGKEIIKNFNMRGVGESVKMFCNGKIIGERVLPIAIKELYPGSIILHNGRRYRCVNVNVKELEAELVEAKSGDEITEPLYISIPRIVSVELENNSVVNAYYCSLEVTMSVYGYITRGLFSKERRDIKYLERPISYTFPTKGFLFSCPIPEPEDYKDYYAGSFHALEHVLIESSDALTGGGSKEIGGIATPKGDIFVYDGTAGGSGLSKLLFRRLDKAFKISHEILKNCECEGVDGCPSCTYSYQCGNNNQPLNRIGALKVVELILKNVKKETEWEKYTEVAEFKYYP
ncbi:RNA helicase [Archaeoglobales archaeon]|nr:MAG: RNA helicase [Archaeoglobales archaeon]